MSNHIEVDQSCNSKIRIWFFITWNGLKFRNKLFPFLVVISFSICFLSFLELKLSPYLTTITATSSQTIQLNWKAPKTDRYTGEISYYQICYQKSKTSTNSSCSLISAGGNLSEVEITGLHPYQEYRFKIRGVVALGYGPYSNVLLSTTHEAG